MTTHSLKDFYYDYIHWCIKLYIYQIRNNNYPLDHWKTQLKKSLETKNEYCFLIKESEQQQNKNTNQLKIQF